MSRNTYLSPLCGTCLRTDAGGRGVCPETRTSPRHVVRVCGQMRSYVERFVLKHVPPSHHGHVVRVCGQTRVLPGVVLSVSPYHIASSPMWYGIADRWSWRASCLSANTYLSPSCGTRLRTNSGGTGRLSKNPYHSPSCGTGLRINSLCAGLISKRRSPSDLRSITCFYACGSLLRCAMTSTTMPSIRSGILST